MNKEDVVHIYNAILAIKKNETMSFVATWMDLEIIILREVNHTQKDKHHMISLMWNLKKNRYKNIYADRNRFTDFENKLVVTKGHSCGEDGLRVWNWPVNYTSIKL